MTKEYHYFFVLKFPQVFSSVPNFPNIKQVSQVSTFLQVSQDYPKWQNRDKILQSGKWQKWDKKSSNGVTNITSIQNMFGHVWTSLDMFGHVWRS